MRISDWSTEVCSSDLHYVGRLLLEVGERVFARRRLDDRPALVFERQLHGRADAFVVFHGEDARSHDRKPMGCRPPLRGSGLSGWALPARALAVGGEERVPPGRSEEHTSELQSLMRISYAVFCLKKKKKTTT